MVKTLCQAFNNNNKTEQLIISFTKESPCVCNANVTHGPAIYDIVEPKQTVLTLVIWIIS